MCDGYNIFFFLFFLLGIGEGLGWQKGLGWMVRVDGRMGWMGGMGYRSVAVVIDRDMVFGWDLWGP